MTPANAQIAIDQLVEDSVLAQIGNGRRNRVWQAPEIIDAMENFAAELGAAAAEHLSGAGNFYADHLREPAE